MKVIILAGGWGTRLGQQTEDIPKPMVPIGNKPILWHIMKIYSHYGFNDFIISLGVKAYVIKNYFAHYESYSEDFTIDMATQKIEYHSNHSEKNWKVTLVDTGLNTLKGARIKRVEKYLDDDTNMVTYGDGVADINIKDLLDYHKSHRKIISITGVHPPARFGELIEKDGRVISFQEKPQTSLGIINGGFMVFNRNLLDYLTENENCDFEIGPLDLLTEQGDLMVYKHEGQWECIDHERDVVHLNRLWNTNQAFWKVWD
ncbi:glucose-1-phosphate cytidylyltransferase [candidate division KSB1 bacterium]|nr:glucose-1-phosphate cytidylyltransferase [candidate division KSB1 bacterium]